VNGKFGVFLLGFGAPRSLDRADLADFLEKVTGSRPMEESVSGLARRYEAIGGLSPLIEISRDQATALEEELVANGISSRVYLGMRFGEPSIQSVVKTATQDGITKAMSLTQSPLIASTVAEVYKKAIFYATVRTGAAIELIFVDSYASHSGFIKAVCNRLQNLFDSLPDLSPPETPIVFTAHSLPGEPATLADYTDQFNESSSMIAKELRADTHMEAFQSRGRDDGKWLGPSVEEVLDRLSKEGCKAVVTYPLGFVSENLETLYDLDIRAAQHARSLGIAFHRAGALNSSPLLIQAWVKIILRGLESIT